MIIDKRCEPHDQPENKTDNPFAPFPLEAGFISNASIDFVVFDVIVERKTNFQTLQEFVMYEFELYSKPYVKAKASAAGGAATRFDIRIQNPHHSAKIWLALQQKLKKRFGQNSFIRIKEIEVSIDFRNRRMNKSHLESMVLVLMRGIEAGYRDRRQWIPKGAEKLDYDATINPLSTMYIGDRTDDVFWRVYLKEFDAGVLLPIEKQSARLEVNLKGNMLIHNGFSGGNIDSLLFTRLAKLFSCRCIKKDLQPETNSVAALLDNRRRMGLKRIGMHAYIADKRSRRKHSPLTIANQILNRKIRVSLQQLEKQFNQI